MGKYTLLATSIRDLIGSDKVPVISIENWLKAIKRVSDWNLKRSVSDLADLYLKDNPQENKES